MLTQSAKTYIFYAVLAARVTFAAKTYIFISLLADYNCQ